MIVVEIPENSNCPSVDLRVFHDVKPPVQISRVRLERVPSRPEWYDLTGWTLAHTPCPAWAQPVDDSGEGVALLVMGGDAGLRLRPAGSAGPWQLGDSQQWGEPFLLVADLHINFAPRNLFKDKDPAHEMGAGTMIPGHARGQGIHSSEARGS